MCRFEPMSLISALSALTTRLGLGATVSTSFTEPYNVARLFASIDRLSQGRADWNVVTSSRPKAALNFNLDRQMDHELRYQRGEEFVDVVEGLWDCWDDGALIADKASSVYIDDNKIRPLDHKGRFFQVKGPMNIALPAGTPGHHRGRRLAFGAGTRRARRRCRLLGRAGAGQRQEGLCRSEGEDGEVRPLTRAIVGIARRHADHRRERG
jgi:alkanesulfonate monooxygenase SsuD/methylene tetrahydromethanopterin reductase-like flavin-dependent oxidoreductase (luciferase family)